MAGLPSEFWEEKKVLIIGRAAPEQSRSHLETVCTGGLCEDGRLLRLYPIPYRYLRNEQQYRLWSWASFEVQKNPKDTRKESFKVKDGSIKIIGYASSDSERFGLLEKAIVTSREELEQRAGKDRTSLGVIEVEFVGIKPVRVQKPQKWYTTQGHLYAERKYFAPPPFELEMKYRCKNNPTCRGHESTLFGWEYKAALKRFKVQYGGDYQAYMKISQKLLDRFQDESRRAFALLGTHHRFGSWMVAQLYFFPKTLSGRLF